MTAHNQLAIVAACAGDPARANMLSLLMDGRAFTAGELSAAASIMPQTASGHLARMVDAGLLTVAQQGRHRYYRLASLQVGQMLEGMMVVAAADPSARKFGPRDQAMRFARTCYDHLAGQLAIAIADKLMERDYLLLSDDGGEITPSGRAFFSKQSLDLNFSRTAPFAGRASTGASGAIISPERSARGSRTRSLNGNGSCRKRDTAL